MNKWTSGANAQLRMLALKMFCRKREITVSKYLMVTSPSCSGTPFDPFPKQSLVFTCLWYNSTTENTVGKREIARNDFYFLTMFPTLQDNFLPFSLNSELSSAIFSIGRALNLLFGKELMKNNLSKFDERISSNKRHVIECEFSNEDDDDASSTAKPRHVKGQIKNQSAKSPEKRICHKVIINDKKEEKFRDMKYMLCEKRCV